jgi:hypothetical protein
MNLLSNESVLVRSNDDKIILTNLRIHMTSRKWGKTYRITIFLEDISSIENVHKGNGFYLVLAIISFLLSIINIFNRDNIPSIYGGIILGGIFLSLWLSTRGHQVTFSSRGGSPLNFMVDQMDDQQIEDFIQKVEEARLQRLKQL